jgi:hypothetical protein
MSTKTLSQQVSGEAVCAVLIILAILSVPKYFKLPDSLELLFHDVFGQILLLLFAILIGSYSFLCGILLVVLFISIILQTKKSVTEGFIGAPDSDMILGKPKSKSSENFEDQVGMSNSMAVTTPVATMAPMAPMATMAPMAKAAASNSVLMKTSTVAPAMAASLPTAAPAVAGSTMAMPMPMPTVMASEAKFPSDLEGYKTTIKKLEEELNECKATNLTLRTNMSGNVSAEPLPTMGTNMSSSATKPETFEDVDEDELESKARKITVMSTDDGAEEIDGDVEEGFCGCNRSDNRVKLAKVVAQSEPSFDNNSPYENFQNPPTVPQMKSSSINPYDVAGCRYDNDYEKDLHDTFYGPPLASCRAYNGSTKSIGTLFYPMN